MKILMFAAVCLLPLSLVAQSWNDSERAVIKTTQNFLKTGTAGGATKTARRFADYFMKKAVMIDSNGNIRSGRANILRAQDAPADSRCKTLLHCQVRLIRPDLAVVAAFTRNSPASGAENSTGNLLSYSILWRRIDAEWYIESCTIVPARADAAGTCLNDN